MLKRIFVPTKEVKVRGDMTTRSSVLWELEPNKKYGISSPPLRTEI